MRVAVTESAEGAPPGQNLSSWAHDWIIRTSLICLTLLIAVLCILLLAGTLTQSRISSISVDGVNISVWKLDDIRKQWKDIRDQLDATTTELNQAHKRQTDLDVENANFRASYPAERTDIDARLAAYVALVSEFDKAHATAIGNADQNSPVERLNKINLFSAQLLAIPELKAGTQDIIEAGKKYQEIDRQRIEIGDKINLNNESIEKLNKETTSLTTSLDNLFNTQFNNKPLDAPTRVRVENALFELYSGRGTGYFLNSLIISPPDILSLALVVSMGVLGSVLQMTHALFVNNRTAAVGAYLLRLCVGAITALVIFIVTKAAFPTSRTPPGWPAIRR
jgi:outer membrane murein-binding lipoprotein Lpp